MSIEKYTGVQGQACAICLAPYTPQDFTKQKIHKTACEHFFHSECLARWMKERASCPTCIQKIDFDKESACWNTFLQEVHAAIEKKFADCDSAPQEVDDEALARQLQEKEAQKKQAEKTQIRQDRLLAMRLAQEPGE